MLDPKLVHSKSLGQIIFQYPSQIVTKNPDYQVISKAAWATSPLG